MMDKKLERDTSFAQKNDKTFLMNKYVIVCKKFLEGILAVYESYNNGK